MRAAERTPAGAGLAGGRLHVVVPASGEGIRRACDSLEGFVAAHRLSPTDAWPFLVALDEVLSNTLRWGLAGDGEGHEVEIQATFEAGLLAVSIGDDAPAFDPLEVPPPDTAAPLAERPLGGLGLLVVRKLMDDVTYERRDGRNWLTLARRVR